MGAVENIIYNFKFKADTDEIDQSEQKTKSLTNQVIKLGTGLIAAAGVKDIMGKAIGRIDTIDTATKSLAILTGSEEQAQKVMDGLVKAIEGTPIALDEVALGAKKMVAAGMEGEKVTDVFTAMADAAYGVGDGEQTLTEFTDIFAKIQSQGKLTTESMDSLQIRGVQSWKILANESGKSADQIREDVRNGAIGAEEGMDMLVKGIENGTKGMEGETVKMGGLAKTAGDTISGSFKNASLSLVKTATKILQPLKDPFIEFNKWFAEKMGVFNEKLEEAINGMVEKLGKFDFSKMFGSSEETSRVGKDLLEMFQMMGETLAPFLPVIEKIGEVIGELLVQAFEQLSPWVEEAIQFWDDLMIKLQPLIELIASTLIPAIELVGYYISYVMSVLSILMQIVWEIVKPIIMGIVDILVAILTPAIQVVKKILEFLIPIMKTVAEKAKEVASDLKDKLEPAFTLVRIAVKLVVAVFKIIIEIIKQLIKKQLEMYNQIKDKILGIFDQMHDTIDNATGPFKDLVDWVKEVIKWFEKMWDKVGEVLGEMENALDNFNPANWFKAFDGGINVFGDPNLDNPNGGSGGTTINQTFNIEAKSVMSKRDVYIASKTAARRV